jgi:hypothetical protein
MIFRAIFWIGLVALLMPHEPDLGYGRPGAHLSNFVPGGGPSLCTGHESACASGLSLFDRFQDVAVRSLDQVRADIDAHRRTAQPRI